MKKLCFALVFVMLCGRLAFAKDATEIAENLPVAIVAGTSGDVQIRSANGDWRKCWALDLLPPQTQLKTGNDGQITVIFFYDDHREIVTSGSEASTAFRNLQKVHGDVSREASKSGGSEFEMPYVIMVRLKQNMFKHADDPGEEERENDFLASYVKVTAYPPVFHWKDKGVPKYRLQLFNEWDEFIYEASAADPSFKFPYKPPFRLIKSGQYYWQVLSTADDVVVRKYGFRLLTLPLVKELGRQEKSFEETQARQPGEPTSYTELFLVYNQYHTLDKTLHHLRQWQQVDSNNPNIYRYLARAYLLKGCPRKAREALDQAAHLGAPDAVEK